MLNTTLGERTREREKINTCMYVCMCACVRVCVREGIIIIESPELGSSTEIRCRSITFESQWKSKYNCMN